VVHRHRLAGPEHADVDPDLWEALFAFEGAERPERATVTPARFAGIQHKQPVSVWHRAFFVCRKLASPTAAVSQPQPGSASNLPPGQAGLIPATLPLRSRSTRMRFSVVRRTVMAPASSSE